MIAHACKFSILVVLLLVSYLAAAPAETQEITGKVIAVTDGDTIKILIDKQTITVRLEGIDAPEANQTHGNKAKEALAALVAGKIVTVRKTGVDKYGRTLGFIMFGNVEANAKLVEDGWAWHFKKYNNEERLSKLEIDARTAKRGLWSNPNPLEPWEYRARLKLRPEILADKELLQPAPSNTVSKEQFNTLVQQVLAAGTDGKSHWLNTSSGIRHNQSCQHYGKTKGGRSCGPNEGRACKICGG